MKTNAAPARGMRDVRTAEVALRDRAAAAIQACYERFGFRRLETPAVEHIGLLTSGQGGETVRRTQREAGPHFAGGICSCKGGIVHIRFGFRLQCLTLCGGVLRDSIAGRGLSGGMFIHLQIQIGVSCGGTCAFVFSTDGL